MTVTQHRELVAALLSVGGVAEASIEPDDVGGPGTLRLQLHSGVDDVAVAGAVNKLLRSRFGLAVDADRVRTVDEPTSAERPEGAHTPMVSSMIESVRPVAPAPVAEHLATQVAQIPAIEVAGPGRLTIEAVQLNSAGLGATATVTLGLDSRSVDGVAEAAATPTGGPRLVAHAALRAVEAVVDGRARFDVEHVEVATTGPERVVLVVVTLVSERGSERLTGAAVVRDDAQLSVVRAVLAAINRRLEPLLAGS